MTAYKVHVRAFRLLFRLFFLVALPVLFRVFLSRSQLKLYLAVQCGEFGLQLFQLVLLLPHLARYLLQLRNLLFQHFVLRLVLVDDGRNPLQCVQKVSCGSNRVCHRQMPVVVGVLVVALHHEAVVGELQTFFECPLADHLYRKAVKFPDSLVQSTSRGVLGDFLQTLTDDLLIR